MSTVFIAGSIAISRLDLRVKERITNAALSGLSIAVGDADGADSSVQQHLASIQAEHVTVFCSGDRVRNNVGDWNVCHVSSNSEPGTRAFFTAKDRKMAEVSDYGLMIWDSKSTGTLSNVMELLKNGKKSVVYVNKMKTFMNVQDASTLRRLVDVMSESARSKAEKKISLSSKISALEHSQLSLI